MPALKLALSCLLLIVGLFFINSSASAERLNASNYEDGIHTQRVWRNMLFAAYCGLIDRPFAGKCYGDELTTDSSGMIKAIPVAYDQPSNNGAIGMVVNFTAALYQTPPISTKEYLASLGENIGLTPNVAHAQVSGSGQTVLRPILTLWQTTRNIAYLFFILIFLVTGVMIMFRQKINPQTVIGIQQAIPGLVIGLILVAFSYFLAALFVDFAFWGTQFVAQIFIGVQNDPNTPLRNIYNINTAAQNSNVFDLFWGSGFRFENITEIFQSVFGTLNSGGQNVGTLLAAIMGALVGGILGLGIGTVPGAMLGAAVGGGAGFVTGGAGTQGIVAGLAAIVIPLILLIALMIQFFRLLLGLIGTYIQILVMTIAGPFIILFSSIPGRGGAISGWYKGLIANALVFPAVFAAFMFAGVILASSPQLWIDPNTGSGVTLPLFGGLSVEMLRLLLAYGILLGTPAIPDMVRNALGVKGPQGFAQAALGGFMGGFGVGRGATMAGWNRGTARLQRQREAYQKAAAEQWLGGNPPPTIPRGTPWFTRWFVRRP